MTRDKMIEAIAKRLEDYRVGRDGCTSTEAAAAVLDLCGPEKLVWHKIGGSHVMDRETHSIPTGYIVVHTGKNRWKWTALGRGAYGCEPSPEAAQAVAQSHATAAHWANTPLGKLVGVV